MICLLWSDGLSATPGQQEFFDRLLLRACTYCVHVMLFYSQCNACTRVCIIPISAVWMDRAVAQGWYLALFPNLEVWRQMFRLLWAGPWAPREGALFNIIPGDWKNCDTSTSRLILCSVMGKTRQMFRQFPEILWISWSSIKVEVIVR